MAGAHASATGTLSRKGLGELLRDLHETAVSGTLVIERPGGSKCALYFQDGQACKAKIPEKAHFLGRVLLELGCIDEPTMHHTLGLMATQRRLHGEVLLAEGVIDPATLLDALATQVSHKIQWMFHLPPDSVYGFYTGQNFLADWGGGEHTPADLYSAIWRGTLETAVPEVVRNVVDSLGGATLRLSPGAPLARFGLGKTERAVVDVMRAKPQPYEALLATGLAGKGELEAILYALVKTGALAATGPVTASRKPPPPVQTPVTVSARSAPRRKVQSSVDEPVRKEAASAPLPPLSAVADPAATAFLEEARARAAEIGRMNLYEILGVARDASAADVQKAFYDLAKKWHPDRLGKEHASVRGEATKVFARISEAHQVLCDEAKRRDYDELLKTGTGSEDEAQEVERVLNAVTEFQKAEVLLKKGDLAGAYEHAKAAYEADRQQPEYAALYAWVRAELASRKGEKNIKEFLDLLTSASAKTPKNAKIRFWKAQLLKRVGRDREALKDFRWIVRNDPNNLDAVREVRLFRMRGMAADSEEPAASPTAKKVGGFLKGLFKK